MLTKTELRKLYIRKRREVSPKEAAYWSAKAQKAFLNSEIYKNAKQIMIYMPLGNEVDTRDIIKSAKNAGKKLIFPSTDPKTFEITPLLWDGESDFYEGTFSVKEPACAKIADMEKTELIIVPGIVFDKYGNRIGFGKGCYDRMLATTSAIKVGFCYDFQIVEMLPADDYDIKMNFLITESGWKKGE